MAGARGPISQEISICERSASLPRIGRPLAPAVLGHNWPGTGQPVMPDGTFELSGTLAGAAAFAARLASRRWLFTTGVRHAE